MKTSLNALPSILIHCQYVYGIGHMVRVAELAKGLSSSFYVTIVNGGEVIPNFEFPNEIRIVQLPAIFKDEKLDELLSVNTSDNIENCFRKRSLILKQVVDDIRPEILITEHFPFGLLFEKEVIELIVKTKTQNPKAKVVSSVRDIIDSRTGGGSDNQIIEIINKWFDLVLVHGDEHFAPLSASFPHFNRIIKPVIQTGYIVRQMANSIEYPNEPIVLVSVGGGRMGGELLSAVLDSYSIIRQFKKIKLILFVGAFQKEYKHLEDTINELQTKDIQILPFDRKFYLHFLPMAELVISLGGYNSIIEAISRKKKILVYQRGFEVGNEEQDLRIEVFEEAGLLRKFGPNQLNEESLAKLIINEIDNSKQIDLVLNLNGVTGSKNALLNLLEN